MSLLKATQRNLKDKLFGEKRTERKPVKGVPSNPKVDENATIRENQKRKAEAAEAFAKAEAEELKRQEKANKKNAK